MAGGGHGGEEKGNGCAWEKWEGELRVRPIGEGFMRKISEHATWGLVGADSSSRIREKGGFDYVVFLSGLGTGNGVRQTCLIVQIQHMRKATSAAWPANNGVSL